MRIRNRGLATAAGLHLRLSACAVMVTGLLLSDDPTPLYSAAPTRPAAHVYRPALIEGVPHVRQKPDFCGEACGEMMLGKLGVKLTQDDVFNYSGLDPAEGRGCYTRELDRGLKAIGFTTGDVWHRVDPSKGEQELESHFAALHADLRAGTANIVCMHYDASPTASEHFRLVLGYDPKTDEVIYHEPAIERGSYQRMPKSLFLELWPLKYSEQAWTVIRLRLDPGKLVERPKAQPSGSVFTDADYARHIHRLKQQLPSKDFVTFLERPFVVIGDEPAATVERRSKNTVRWAVEHLKQSYFASDPATIIDIWLFKDRESYETNAEQLFDAKPTTPYGYYSPSHRALVMNISTGGGTLVHEIVHPFIGANFSDCPAWFNEGLASLYEQCGEEQGRIHGYPNWRLPSLRQAIKADRVPSFETLCATTPQEFYQQDRGTNYAQARYLCYYLQERGLLEKFYREFVKAAAKDPTGLETLKSVLGVDDLDAFKKDWEAFVLKVKYE